MIKKVKFAKLIISILYILFSLTLTFYFAIAGSIGVFVISQNIMRKIELNLGEVNEEHFFIINIVIASFLGMIPFGLVAVKCTSDWMKKWNIPKLSDAIKE